MSRPTYRCTRPLMLKCLFKRIMIDIDYYHRFITSFTSVKPYIENDILQPRSAYLIPKMYDYVYLNIEDCKDLKLSMVKALSTIMFKDRIEVSDVNIYSDINDFVSAVRSDIHDVYEYVCGKYNAHMITDIESIQLLIADKRIIPVFKLMICRFEIYVAVSSLLVHMYRPSNDIRNAMNDDLTKWASFLYVLLSHLKNVLFYLTNDSAGNIFVSKIIKQPDNLADMFRVIDTEHLNINEILYVSYNSTTVLTTNETYTTPSWLVSFPQTLKA